MIYTLGESLLDVVIAPDGTTVAKPGGAMLNVAVSLARAGEEVSLISETGKDLSGEFILDFLKENEINTSFITAYKNQKTSLALAFLNENKKPSYSFYKRYPKSRTLKQPTRFSPHDLLLFGSLYSLDPAIGPQIAEIRKNFVKTGGLLLFDPNIRNGHQLEKAQTKKVLFQNLKDADIIKGSDEDFENIFGIVDPAMQLEKLKDVNAKALLVVTQGAKGVIARYKGQTILLKSRSIEPVSTIGAGDAFSTGLIYGLRQAGITKNNLYNLSLKEVQNSLQSGIRFATQVCLLQENYIGKDFTKRTENK